MNSIKTGNVTNTQLTAFDMNDSSDLSHSSSGKYLILRLDYKTKLIFLII